eukprot:scaffold92682_cov18-Tisochrysis_lutea.AAC.1
MSYPVHTACLNCMWLCAPAAGPREDIIVPLTLASNGVGGFLPPDDFAAPQPPNGFLATSLQEFTDAIFQVRPCPALPLSPPAPHVKLQGQRKEDKPAECNKTLLHCPNRPSHPLTPMIIISVIPHHGASACTHLPSTAPTHGCLSRAHPA